MVKAYFDKAFEKQDGASLAAFRIMIGLLLMGDVLGGKLVEKFEMTDFTPSYYGFGWVQPDPQLMGYCAMLLPFTVFFVIIGLFYRVALPLTTLMVGYLFFAFPEHYLNHYYMLLLMCALLSFMPAHKVWSLDAVIHDETEDRVPAWCYWALKLQTEVILIYAGLVKINPDWLNLQPLGTWLRHHFYYSYDSSLINWLLSFDAVIAIGAYGVILLHVVGAPLLFWNRARPWVFGFYTAFHLSNAMLFRIGIFPYMTIAATLLFFNPGWPRQVLGKLKPAYSSLLSLSGRARRLKVPKQAFISVMCLWILVQIIIPMRPFLLSTNLETAWTTHRDFFTWRMMLNDRAFYTVSLAVHMPDQKRVEFVPIAEHLTKRQCLRVTGSPNGLVQFAAYLQDHYRKKYGTETVSVHAYIVTGINYRVPELWVNPKVNLADYKPSSNVPNWIKPVKNPLRSWDEYRDGPKYVAPSYEEVLEAMGLSNAERIIFDQGSASLETLVEMPKCKNRILSRTL